MRWQLSGLLAPSILPPTGCGTDFVPRHDSALFASALPVTVGLVIGSGTVMARAADTNWPAAAVTVTAAALMLRTAIISLLILIASGALGGLGLL